VLRGENARLPCSRVLVWRRQLVSERLCRVRRPIRVHQHLPREQHHIRLTVAHDVVRLFRFGDETDGGGWNVRAVPDFFRRTAPDSRGLTTIFASGTTPPELQSIKSTPAALSNFAERDALLNVPAPSFQSIAEIRTASGSLSGQTCRTGARRVQQQADAILKIAAVYIRAVIRERRKKFVEQIAVRRV